MNHYPRHVGDFIKDTVGLSLAERGAYTALLDQYYASEKPIQHSERYRITGAVSKSDRAAVDYVIARYFTEQPDGWHQKRANREIEAYREKVSEAKRAINTRWDRVRKTKNINDTDVLRSNAERNTNPITSNQNQEEPKSTAMSSSAEKPPNLDVVPLKVDRSNSERRDAAREILGFLNAKTGRNYRMVDANLGPIMARMKEGATVRDLRAVVARKCREWGGDEKMAAYLRPATLFNATKFAQYVGEVPPPEPEVSDALS